MTSFTPDGPSAHQTSGPRGLDPMAIVVAAMAGALVMLGLILPIVGAEPVMPETWMLVAVGLATLAAWALVIFLPLPRRSPSREGLVQSLVILRAAILEAPAMLGLALAFVSQPMSLLPYLLPALFALAGLWLFARPSVVRARVDSAR